MGFFGCCRSNSTFKALSRAAAKSAAAKLRRGGVLSLQVDWAHRAEICERCPLRVVSRGVSYCGKPFLQQVDREPLDGCGCPTRDKAKSPGEHCPLNKSHQPADQAVCDCKWCA